MTVDAIAALSALPSVAATGPGGVDAMFGPTRPDTAAAPFETWFAKEVGAVNDKMIGAENEVKQVALGGEQSLHDVMIHLEEARLSFQLLAQVRNRLLEAYQDVMRMQV
ncbi:flagellar hook-basal body complex protein FliE [Massilia sp. P8910]|uniref:flagellar hook-basal body complex protein FliE n=1 Tax=Massilia antarctica TaxID=2765360 RepID=UPI0006BB59A7|nr:MULTISPECIES: flagellar hook-basal body complex protein FliE [Massilia]MCE3602789.1 flagellar hook-basal body complex protein FliE [Massilia antarctica]MCY0915674.1 flagellar hook-basal body complex protein FliE [Massilia sp. H27-R4]CUI02866.1 Flagellar hook-basal body complex protein FliE [Janthinobacterium sp. CG23_2]CUU26652.1 Flagellar hook-basal body complex protein FliE [Janthinobacterium sp. CG23_2]